MHVCGMTGAQVCVDLSSTSSALSDLKIKDSNAMLQFSDFCNPQGSSVNWESLCVSRVGLPRAPVSTYARSKCFQVELLLKPSHEMQILPPRFYQ